MVDFPHATPVLTHACVEYPQLTGIPRQFTDAEVSSYYDKDLQLIVAMKHRLYHLNKFSSKYIPTIEI